MVKIQPPWEYTSDISEKCLDSKSGTRNVPTKLGQYKDINRMTRRK